jgi:ATP-dependent DNA ligase
MVLLRQRSRSFSGHVEPCLPRPANKPPAGPGWLHEIKHDGFRIMARRDTGGVRLMTRAGNDFAGRFPCIAMALAALPAQSCIIDGEDLRREPIEAQRARVASRTIAPSRTEQPFGRTCAMYFTL